MLLDLVQPPVQPKPHPSNDWTNRADLIHCPDQHCRRRCDCSCPVVEQPSWWLNHLLRLAGSDLRRGRIRRHFDHDSRELMHVAVHVVTGPMKGVDTGGSDELVARIARNGVGHVLVQHDVDILRSARP